MHHGGRLTLSTTVDVDLDWDGVGRVTRIIAIDSHDQGTVDLDGTKIELLIHSRDVVDIVVRDDIGGDPDWDPSSVFGGTLLKVWPGIVAIKDSAYRMTVTYRQIDFASRFETGRLVYCTDPVEVGGVDGTEFGSRQQFTYRILLPKREYFWIIPDLLNVVERHDNSTSARSKDRRELLEWEWVGDANERAKRLQVLYMEKTRARLVDWLKQLGLWFFMFLVGAVGVALKPGVASWIRDVLHLR